MGPPHPSTTSHRGASARRARRVLIAVAVLVACVLSGCTGGTGTTGRITAGPAAPTPPKGSPPTSNAPGEDGKCVANGWFDCDLRARFATIERYVKSRPGFTGIEVHDRLTGAVWASANADIYIWTASSIKLAMAVNLLQRNRVGEIELSAEDWDLLLYMLSESDNYATDYLWSTYGGLPSEAYLEYGLPDLLVTDDQPGVWGSELATPAGMAGLVDYALGSLDPVDASWLIDALSSVIEDQRWGVLDLEDEARAGAKNGWDQEPTGWVVNSVGFVGPQQRYSVAIMNDLGEDGGFDDGVETVSTVADLLFAERF